MKTVALFACACALSTTLLVPIHAVAQSSAKQTPARSVAVKRVFPFYDLYLSLPVETRDGFRMDYRLNLPAGSPRPQLNYILGTSRTVIDVAPNGQILNLPSREMLSNGQVYIGANQPRAGVIMDLEPLIPLSNSIGVGAATNPLNDYAAAVRRAGPLAALAPKLRGIVFKGGTGGEVVFTDGRRTALPAAQGGVLFQPSAPTMRGAASLSFATPPARAEFSQ